MTARNNNYLHMKMKITLLLITFFTGFLYAQTPAQLRQVIDQTDVATLKILSAEFKEEYESRQEKINNFLALNPQFPKRYVEDLVEYEIYDIENNTPVYSQTDNRNSAITSRSNRLYNGGALGLNVQGQGMTAHIWDGGIALQTHVEFPNNKIFVFDAIGSLSSHATHVTGTVVAQGITASLRGNAFNASAVSYDWNNDLEEITNAAANGMLVSNHSYWSGSSSAAWTFGAYDSRARSLDQITFAAPFYLFVGSAGNDRNNFTSSIIGPYLNQKGGYNLVKGMHNAKNTLTVGAVEQVSIYNGPQSVLMSSFSSWGPADDGRIKPEIVTKGTEVRSTWSTSDTANAISQGTSMSAPGITGSAILLQQHYNNLNASFMRAATLKGLIMHSADEAGPAQGPDYMFGWGLMNTERAATIITRRHENKHIIQENVLANGATFTTQVYATGTEPLMASISWTERAFTANNGTNDPVGSHLINDLDIRVTRDGQTFFPWRLQPSSPASEALRDGDNNIDNFEKIEIDTPTAGLYTITVSHKGSLVSGNQTYSLIVSGIDQTLSNQTIANAEFAIYPNPSNGLFTIATEGFDNKTLEIFDIQGRNVFLTALISNLNDINVSYLPKGVYMARLIAGDQVTTKKIVIQ